MKIEGVDISNEKDEFRQEAHVSPESLEGRSDRHLIKDTLELINRPDLFLGEGAVGRVFSFSMRDRRFCQKVALVRDVAARNEENVPQEYRRDYREQAARREGRPWTLSAKMEAYLTNRAAAIEDETVRVPLTYRTLHISGAEDGDTYMVRDSYDVILMQQVPGYNLQQIAERGVPLPDGFDIEGFADDLLRFVRKMNARGIFHRDIAPRNVMLDLETGRPWLIDFGRGTNDPADPYSQEITKEGRSERLRFDRTDEDCVELVRQYLRTYRDNRAELDSFGK